MKKITRRSNKPNPPCTTKRKYNHEKSQKYWHESVSILENESNNVQIRTQILQKKLQGTCIIYFYTKTQGVQFFDYAVFFKHLVVTRWLNKKNCITYSIKAFFKINPESENIIKGQLLGTGTYPIYLDPELILMCVSPNRCRAVRCEFNIKPTLGRKITQRARKPRWGYAQSFLPNPSCWFDLTFCRQGLKKESQLSKKQSQTKRMPNLSWLNIKNTKDIVFKLHAIFTGGQISCYSNQ